MNELVAQQVEQRPFKAWVLGSNPSELTTPPGRGPFQLSVVIDQFSVDRKPSLSQGMVY